MFSLNQQQMDLAIGSDTKTKRTKTQTNKYPRISKPNILKAAKLFSIVSSHCHLLGFHPAAANATKHTTGVVKNRRMQPPQKEDKDEQQGHLQGQQNQRIRQQMLIVHIAHCNRIAQHNEHPRQHENTQPFV
jgi:hypothetical protein